MQAPDRNLWIHTLVAAAAALTLAGCGGGGGGGGGFPIVPIPAPPPPPPPPPPPVTLSGDVARIGMLKNVVVCLDLNANDACDEGEPASAPTGADGQYTLVYDATAQPAATAALIAQVKAGDPAAATTAIDAANPAAAATTAEYVLKRSAGAGGAINPLTTLVQAGVAAGMSEDKARANVALQLAIALAKIDNYQDDPAWSNAEVQDTARTAAGIISGMVRDGVPLEVGDPDAAQPETLSLRQLNYAGADEFYVRTLQGPAKAAGEAASQVFDQRSGKSGGATGTDDWYYRSAYLGPDGWVFCDRDTPIANTLGNPSRSVFCEGETSLGYTTRTSVAGQSMADLVSRWQGLAGNTINSGSSADALNGALGNAAFPSDATESLRTNLTLGQVITIDNVFTRGVAQSRNTLEAVIDYYPSSGAASPTSANTLSLALSSSALRNLRVSFAPTSATQGTATYYECDLNADQSVASNCAALAAKGSYRIETLNGARLLRFAGQPPTPALNYEVLYAQIRWTANDPSTQWVYRTHQTKPALSVRLSSNRRLNGAAWNAMKTQLGL